MSWILPFAAYKFVLAYFNCIIFVKILLYLCIYFLTVLNACELKFIFSFFIITICRQMSSNTTVFVFTFYIGGGGLLHLILFSLNTYLLCNFLIYCSFCMKCIFMYLKKIIEIMCLSVFCF